MKTFGSWLRFIPCHAPRFRSFHSGCRQACDANSCILQAIVAALEPAPKKKSKCVLL